MLVSVGSKNATLEDQGSCLVKFGGVGNDFVEKGGKIVVGKDGGDVDRVAVGEEEEFGLSGGF